VPVATVPRPGRRDTHQVGTQRRYSRIVGDGGIEREQRRVVQRRGGQQGSYLRRHFQRPRLLYPVDFAERHGTAMHSQQLQYAQVFARLWHHAVIGGDHQKREIDASGAGYHRMHQPLMAWDVNDSQGLAADHGRIGIAELDGDSAFLLLLEPVRIDAGQGAHQAGLAVVDVTGCADDHRPSVLHCAWNSASSPTSRQRRSSHSALSASRPMTGRGKARSLVSS